MVRQLCSQLGADLVAAGSDTGADGSPFWRHPCVGHGFLKGGYNAGDNPAPACVGDTDRHLRDQCHSQAVGGEYRQGKTLPGRE